MATTEQAPGSGAPLSGGMNSVPHVSAWEAIRRHPWLTGFPVVLGVVAAIAVGIVREPTYKATTRMAVGGLDLGQPGALGGYSDATKALAETYSRSIDAEAVINPVARQTGLTPGAVDSAVTASPVPESPVFNVQAEASNVSGAVLLANAAGAAVSRYAAEVSSTRETSARLYRQFRAASADASQRESEFRQLRGKIGTPANAFERKQIADASSAMKSAQLRASSLGDAYRRTQEGQGSAGEAQVVSRASSASSDRGSFLQLALFIGLVVGAILGVALATLLANREVRRHFEGELRVPA